MMTDNPQATIIIDENEKPWGVEKEPAGCTRCHHLFLVNPSALTTNCPVCRQGRLEPQPARMRSAEPELMLPFQIGKQNLLEIYNHFTSGVWIKLDDFTPEHLLERTVPLFWPMWLVDSDIHGHWQMEAGFDYQVESTKEHYSTGRWSSHKELEDRVRWEPRLGELETHVDNIAVPALEEHQTRAGQTRSYHLNRAQPFAAEKLAGAPLQIPDLPPEDAWPTALPIVKRKAAEICAKAAGAQHQRNFSIKADYQGLHWTQLLLPLYTTYYTDDDGQPRVLTVNGETGFIHGLRLASRKKGSRIAGILAGIAGGLLLLALLGFLLTMALPAISLLAALFAVLGFGVGIAAIFPAVWPAQWNRRQLEEQVQVKEV